MNDNMTPEQMQPFFDNDLYHFRLVPNAGTELVPMAQPNPTYCRPDAPVYEWTGTQWAIVGGTL